jgi:hypothetical protein
MTTARIQTTARLFVATPGTGRGTTGRRRRTVGRRRRLAQLRRGRRAAIWPSRLL